MAVLTGMGLWQGAHCAEAMLASSPAGTRVAATQTSSHVAHATHSRQQTVAAKAIVLPGPAPITPAAGDCHVVPFAAVSAVSAATVAPPNSGGTVAYAPWRPTLPVVRVSFAPALEQIGVSRT